jgi:hypothetical protein
VKLVSVGACPWFTAAVPVEQVVAGLSRSPRFCQSAGFPVTACESHESRIESDRPRPKRLFLHREKSGTDAERSSVPLDFDQQLRKHLIRTT